MPEDDKWVFSSSGRNMFVSFRKGLVTSTIGSMPGFIAKIHYGNYINDVSIFALKHKLISRL